MNSSATDEPRGAARRRSSADPARAGRHLAELIDLSVDAVISVDEEQRVTLFNRGAERMFGYEASEVLGRDVSMLMPARLRDRHEDYLTAFGEAPDGSRMMGERGRIVGLRRDGEEFPAEASIAKTTIDGEPVFSVIVRDVGARVEAEGKLREAEVRWHDMADALPIFFSFVDASERYVFVNRTYADWFGGSRDEIVGRTVADVVGGRMYEKIRPHVRAALEGERRRFHLAVESAGGQERPLDVIYEPQRSDGDVDGFFVAAVDVTERVEVEGRLRRRGEAIRTLYQVGAHPSLTLGEKVEALLALGCGQFQLDLGVFARVNADRWSAQHVHPRSSTLAPGDRFPLRDTLCARAIEGSDPVEYSGSSRDDGSGSHPAYPDEPLGAYLGAPVVVTGKSYGVLSFTSARPRRGAFSSFQRDLIRLMAYWLGSEIEREQAFRSQAFLANAGRVLAFSLDRSEILERLVDLTVPVLGDGCIVYDLRPDGIIDRVDSVHVDPDVNARLAELPVGSIEKGSVPHPVLSVVRTGEAALESWNDEEQDRPACLPDTEWAGLPPELCASLLVVPIRSRREVLLGAMAFFAPEPEHYSELDVTLAQELGARAASALENASLLEEARAAVGARDEILSFVSHDLGSPLSSISMSVEYVLGLLEDDEDSEELRSYLAGMSEAAERMERLIEDLLEVRVMEETRSPMPTSEVQAQELLEVAVRELRPRFEAGSLQLEISKSTDASVRADRNRLLRVLVNLLDNAAKFTEPGGRIEVGAEESADGEVHFFVSDTGQGISAERLERIFDRYAQVREERRAGAGLGLSIVKKTVEAYGGRVWVESEVGVGSTFHFTVPVS